MGFPGVSWGVLGCPKVSWGAELLGGVLRSVVGVSQDEGIS